MDRGAVNQPKREHKRDSRPGNEHGNTPVAAVHVSSFTSRETVTAFDGIFMMRGRRGLRLSGGALSAHLPLQGFRIAIAMQRDRRQRFVYLDEIG